MEWNELSNNFLVNEGMTANKGNSFFQTKHYMILKHNYKNLKGYHKTPVFQSSVNATINCSIFNHTNLKLCKNSTKQTVFQGHIFTTASVKGCRDEVAPEPTYFTYEAGQLKWQNTFRKVILDKFLHNFLKKLSDEEREHIFSKIVQPSIQPIIQWTHYMTLLGTKQSVVLSGLLICPIWCHVTIFRGKYWKTKGKKTDDQLTRCEIVTISGQELQNSFHQVSNMLWRRSFPTHALSYVI